MKTSRPPFRGLLRLGAAALPLLGTVPAQACAVCFGKTDSPLGKGLHWGVLALLGIVFAMLAAFGAFAVYLARRSAALEAEEAALQAASAEGSSTSGTPS